MTEPLFYFSAAAALLTSLAALRWLSPTSQADRIKALLAVAWVVAAWAVAVYFAWRRSQTMLRGELSFPALCTQVLMVVELLWLFDVAHRLHFSKPVNFSIVQKICALTARDLHQEPMHAG